MDCGPPGSSARGASQARIGLVIVQVPRTVTRRCAGALLL